MYPIKFQLCTLNPWLKVQPKVFPNKMNGKKGVRHQTACRLKENEISLTNKISLVNVINRLTSKKSGAIDRIMVKKRMPPAAVFQECM